MPLDDLVSPFFADDFPGLVAAVVEGTVPRTLQGHWYRAGSNVNDGNPFIDVAGLTHRLVVPTAAAAGLKRGQAVSIEDRSYRISALTDTDHGITRIDLEPAA